MPLLVGATWTRLPSRLEIRRVDGGVELRVVDNPTATLPLTAANFADLVADARAGDLDTYLS